MKIVVTHDYKPTRYEGKGFLGNLNIRIHRDITGEMWVGVGWLQLNESYSINPLRLFRLKQEKEVTNTSIRIIGCSCLLNKLLDKLWGKD